MSDSPTPDDAAAFLRAEHRGVLVADGRPRPARWVRCPRRGRLIAPVDRDALEASELVLFIPDEGEGSGQALVQPHDILAEDQPALMRWSAYHGDERFAHWASLELRSLKWAGGVLGGDEIDLTNALASHEPTLVRAANRDRPKLARACARLLGVASESLVAVGADAHGLDIKLRFGVARLSLPEPARDAAHALTLIDSLLDGGAS